MHELQILWPIPGELPALDNDEVHVWAFPLDVSAERRSLLAQLLNSEERARGERFHFARDAERFIVAHAQLRRMLAHYVWIPAQDLSFAFGPAGKPQLAGAMVPTLHFNLSHSQNLGVIALTQLSEVGVDVEFQRPIEDEQGIADRFFSARESQGLRGLPQPERSAAFYRIWTRKEAWLKATGEGISESLPEVEVSFHDNEPARMVRLFGDEQAAAQWGLWDLRVADGFSGAVALPAPTARIRCWQWE